MLGQLRIFERSHLNKVSFELHLPWRVVVAPFSYKTGCTSQSCQNSLITSPWKLLLASEEVMFVEASPQEPIFHHGSDTWKTTGDKIISYTLQGIGHCIRLK